MPIEPETDLDFTRRQLRAGAPFLLPFLDEISPAFVEWFLRSEGKLIPGETGESFDRYVNRFVLAWRAWEAGRAQA
jgi:hypothetical protein